MAIDRMQVRWEGFRGDPRVAQISACHMPSGAWASASGPSEYRAREQCLQDLEKSPVYQNWVDQTEGPDRYLCGFFLVDQRQPIATLWLSAHPRLHMDGCDGPPLTADERHAKVHTLSEKDAFLWQHRNARDSQPVAKLLPRALRRPVL